MDKKKVRIPQQKRSIEKKERIIEAANRAFNQKGYFEIYINEIAEEAGLSTGTVYAYFKDKKDILLACLERSRQKILHDITKEIAGLSETGDLTQTMVNILHILIKFHTNLTRRFHDEVKSLQYRDQDIGNYYMDTQSAMMNTVTQEINRQGYAFRHPHEQIFLACHMVDRIQDELAFSETPDIDPAILVTDCAEVIVSMLVKTEKQIASTCDYNS